MGQTRTRGHKCLLYDGAWLIELLGLSLLVMLETYYFDLFWDPTPTNIPRGNAREDTKGMNTTRNDQRVLATAITRSVVRGSTKHAHLKHFKISRWPTSTIPAISSNGVSSLGGLVLNHVHPRRDPSMIPPPRCQDTRRSLAAPSGDKAWAMALSCSPCADGPTWGGAEDRWWGTLFPQPEWLVRWDIDMEGLKTSCWYDEAWRAFMEKRWTMNGEWPNIMIKHIKHVFLLETFKILHEQILLVQRWCVNNLPLWDKSYCMLNGSGLDLAWILPAHAAEMGAPSPQNMPSGISSAPKQGQIKP